MKISTLFTKPMKILCRFGKTSEHRKLVAKLNCNNKKPWKITMYSGEIKEDIYVVIE